MKPTITAKRVIAQRCVNSPKWWWPIVDGAMLMFFGVPIPPRARLYNTEMYISFLPENALHRADAISVKGFQWDVISAGRKSAVIRNRRPMDINAAVYGEFDVLYGRIWEKNEMKAL